MCYEPISTVRNRMQYRLTSFLLENLASRGTVEWMEAFSAQRLAGVRLGVTERELPWLTSRFDPQAHKSFGVRMSRKIICGDCGRAFGHKVWHAGTSNRVDVWECPTNYVKRGTCETKHLYQHVLQMKITEAMAVLARRISEASSLACDCLHEAGAKRRPSTLRKRVDDILATHPSQLTIHLPDFLSVLEGGCMLTDGRLGFVFITGDAVTLQLPVRWTPIAHSEGLTLTGRC